MECVAGSRRSRPLNFPAQADQSARNLQSSADGQSHGGRSGVPSARRQPLKNALPCRLLVQVKGLRVKFRSECFHSVQIHLIKRGSESLSHMKIIQVQFFRVSVCHWESPILVLRNRTDDPSSDEYYIG